MVILADNNVKAIVQGITGREGRFHTKLMLEYGTNIVAGVTPGKGGLEVDGVPVYDSVEEALQNHPDVSASVLFVPARYLKDAAFEALECGIPLIVVITEGVPILDTLMLTEYAKARNYVVIGPNTPGLLSPPNLKLGIMPVNLFRKGSIGIASRSGTLTYQVASYITKAGLGQSTCVGIGGDPITGLDFLDVYKRFEQDSETEAVVIIGEIGGDMEEKLAKYLRNRKHKPVVAYIAGKTAPPGKRMGHAGAIISMGVGTAGSKIRAFKDSNIPVAELPSQIPELINRLLRR